ncbi:hypothetical protein H0H87_012539 [Tephrocybe sp. NHM501043]|nr:hypothetical protein H0H87_012539 [Tephrocybe sp. NHM501043]
MLSETKQKIFSINIPKLLHIGGRSKLANLDVNKPLPKLKVDVDRSRASSRGELAPELGNYTPGQYPLARYNVGVDQQLQVNAFKVALGTAVAELDLNDFAFRLDPNINNFSAEQATFVDSELNTLAEVDYATGSAKATEAINLMSLEQIFSNKDDIIPALLIRYTDVVGADRLAFNTDAEIYYDDLVDEIHDYVQSRAVYSVPKEPCHQYFRRHAVRAFLQVQNVQGIVGGPFYRSLGDYYILKSNARLPRADWNTLPEFMKEIFVGRFVSAHNAPPADKYRAQNDYSPATARQLLNNGNIYPLIRLKQAYQIEESMSPFSPIMLNNQEVEFFPPPSDDSMDSVSVYSQESAAYNSKEDSIFSFYASAANLDPPLSPSFTDPFAGNVIITFPSGHQEIYSASASSLSYDAEDYGVDHDTEMSAWSENEDDDSCDYYYDSNFGDDDEDSSGRDLFGLVERRDSSDSDHNEMKIHGIGARTCVDDFFFGSPPASAIAFLSEENKVKYDKLTSKIEELAPTADPYTPMGKSQLRLMQDFKADRMSLILSAIA